VIIGKSGDTIPISGEIGSCPQISKAVRVPGSELMPKLCELAARKGYGVFLFGLKEEVNREAAEKLVQRYPELRIAGRASGYLREEEMPELVKKINASGAEIFFVALGSPKQEKWIHQNKDKLNVNFIGAVGAIFDFYAGNVKRSHPWFLKHGLEWLPRLLQEPRRLWRRTFISAPVFFWNVFKQQIKK